MSIEQCPYHNHKLRTDLPPLTERIRSLPIDERGYPVPFFVQWLDSKPDFRIADPQKLKACVKQDLCWVCGSKLGIHKTFVIGPMCGINRTSGEPPTHLDCAQWSVKGCPFMAKPQMKRREDDLTEGCMPASGGVMIKRNPGCMLLWTTRDYRLMPDGHGGVVFKIGKPEHIEAFREGRRATLAEMNHSIETGLPHLREMCPTPEENEALDSAIRSFKRLFSQITFQC